MKQVNRLVEIRGIDQEKREVEFIISTESIDRHGTVFVMDGWDLENYERNPIVCYNHRSSSGDPDDVIGLSVVYKEGNSLIGRVTFEDEGDNAIADKVWNKINKGILKMASVGAIVHDYRYGNTDKGEDSGTIYFTRQELLEWSVVPAGSNPDAFKRSAEQVEDMKKDLFVKPTMGLKTKQDLREWEKVKIVTP